MSLQVMTLVRSVRFPRTMPRRAPAKAVLLALANRCDDNGDNAWPSVATIADETELYPRTVMRALKDLTAAGYIREQAPPRQHRPRTWRVATVTLYLLKQEEEDSRGAKPSTPETTPGVLHQTFRGATAGDSGVLNQTSGVLNETLRGATGDTRSVLNGPLNDPYLNSHEPRASRANLSHKTQTTKKKAEGTTPPAVRPQNEDDQRAYLQWFKQHGCPHVDTCQGSRACYLSALLDRPHRTTYAAGVTDGLGGGASLTVRH